MVYRSVFYIGEQIVLNVKNFFLHWYRDSFFAVFYYAMHVFRLLDRTFALRVTLYNFFQPLYQDHTILGHVLGMVFRTFRVGIALLVYLSLFLVLVATYIVWISIPIMVIVSAF